MPSHPQLAFINILTETGATVGQEGTCLLKKLTCGSEGFQLVWVSFSCLGHWLSLLPLTSQHAEADLVPVTSETSAGVMPTSPKSTVSSLTHTARLISPFA
jgi:hypothetical protein